MDQTSSSTLSENTLHCALELSKKSWLLAIQFPDRDQPSLYAIEGGDAEKLMVKLTAARDCWAKVSGALPVITLCYEVGYDAFWLARFLKARGIECLVIDPGSLQVNRRGRARFLRHSRGACTISCAFIRRCAPLPQWRPV
jgi:transposase